MLTVEGFPSWGYIVVVFCYNKKYYVKNVVVGNVRCFMFSCCYEPLLDEEIYIMFSSFTSNCSD